MRLAPIVEEKLTPAQLAIWQRVTKGNADAPVGPTRAWMTSPEFCKMAHDMGVFCRFGSSLPTRLSEIAILVMGAHWKSDFEWYAHSMAGLEAGLDPAAVEAIRVQGQPHFEKEDEAAVFAFARELVDNKRVSDVTYKRIHAILGDVGMVDVVGILGYYSMISMTLNTFQIPLPAGVAPPFADLAK